MLLKSDSGNATVELRVLFCVETLGDVLLFHLQLGVLEWAKAHGVHTWKKDLEFNFQAYSSTLLC